MSILADVRYGVTWSAALQGIGIGVLVSLLFSIVPLLQVRFIKPSLLLRDESTPRRRDWAGMAAIAAVATALVALASWQAASLKVGIVVCAGFAGLAVVLILAGRGLVALLAPLTASRIFPLRHAVLHLTRPGNQTRVILLAVGLGAFFIVGIRSLQASLLREFSVQTAEDAPDMFLLDIQRDQVEGVRAFLAQPATGAGPVAADSGAARTGGGRVGPGDQSRDRGGRADARIAGARVHHHVSRPSRAERAGAPGSVLANAVVGGGSVRSSGASTIASRSTSATRCGSTSSGAWCRRG